MATVTTENEGKDNEVIEKEEEGKEKNEDMSDEDDEEEDEDDETISFLIPVAIRTSNGVVIGKVAEQDHLFNPILFHLPKGK